MAPPTVIAAERIPSNPEFEVLDAVAQGVIVFGEYGAAAPPLYCNAALATLAGREPGELQARGLSLLFEEGDLGRLRDAVALALADGAAECRDLVGRCADGLRVVLQARLRLDRGLRRVIGTFEDVTRLVDALEQLVVVESHYRALAESSSDVIVVIEPDMTIRIGSASSRQLLGYTPGQNRGRPALDLVHPDDRAAVGEFFRRVVAGETALQIEARIRHADGSHVWMELVARDLLGEPAVGGIVFNLRDISARRRAQDELAARESLMRALFDHSYDITLVTDTAAIIGFVSGNIERQLGYLPEELRGASAFDFIHPDDLAVAAERFREHVLDPAALLDRTSEFRVRRQDGGWSWFEFRTVNCVGIPGVDGLITHMHGIDARKAAEAELSRMRALVAEAVDVAQVAAWDYDVEADRIDWLNDEYFRMIGEEPAIGRARHDRMQTSVCPEDWPRFAAVLARHLAGDTDVFECEYRVVRQDGGLYWLLDRGSVVGRDTDGRPLRMTGITFDIDRRKRAELALRESEQRLETALWGSRTAFWVTDGNGRIVHVSPQWPSVTGLLPHSGQDTYQLYVERVHPDDRQAMLAAADAHIRGEMPLFESEHRLRTDDGRWIWLHGRGRAIEFDAFGRPTRIAGTTIDVTARREMEERHRMQASILQALAEGVVVWDERGYITFGNAAAIAMLGLQGRGILGAHVDQWFDAPDLHASDTRAPLSAEEGPAGPARHLEARLKRADGSTITVACIVTSTYFHRSPRTVLVFQDITARRLLEREIIEVANREQERIGRDLHDGLGQELTGISLLLGGLGNRLQHEYPAARAEVDEVMKLVAHAVQSTRTLARGLSPVAVERAGLVEALRELGTRTRELFGFAVRVHASVDPGVALDMATATQLYRVAQEALTNVARHAQATTATVSVKMSGNRVSLSISDDGRGMPPDALDGNGLGLKIIAYRARMVGGAARFERRPRGGTRVSIRIVREGAPPALDDAP